MKRLPALALVLIIASFVVACTSVDARPIASKTPAPSIGVSSPIPNDPAPWPTYNPWECNKPAPEGWLFEFPKDSGKCVLVLAPQCWVVWINALAFCGPQQGEYQLECVSQLAINAGQEAVYPCKTSVSVAASHVVWETFGPDYDTIVEWSVADTERSAFAGLHRAFYDDAGSPR